jgi:hypothetical protein
MVGHGSWGVVEGAAWPYRARARRQSRKAFFSRCCSSVPVMLRSQGGLWDTAGRGAEGGRGGTTPYVSAHGLGRTLGRGPSLGTCA